MPLPVSPVGPAERAQIVRPGQRSRTMGVDLECHPTVPSPILTRLVPEYENSVTSLDSQHRHIRRSMVFLGASLFPFTFRCRHQKSTREQPQPRQEPRHEQRHLPPFFRFDFFRSLREKLILDFVASLHPRCVKVCSRNDVMSAAKNSKCTPIGLGMRGSARR